MDAPKQIKTLKAFAKGRPLERGIGMATKIFTEIEAERERQDKQWGGKKHDDTHDIRTWVSYIVDFLGRTVNKEASWGYNLKVARTAFIKVAALCVAAIESIDRKLN